MTSRLDGHESAADGGGGPRGRPSLVQFAEGDVVSVAFEVVGKGSAPVTQWFRGRVLRPEQCAPPGGWGGAHSFMVLFDDGEMKLMDPRRDEVRLETRAVDAAGGGGAPAPKKRKAAAAPSPVACSGPGGGMMPTSVLRQPTAAAHDELSAESAAEWRLLGWMRQQANPGLHRPISELFPALWPAYRQKIKRPMDLSTIESKLLRGEYANASAGVGSSSSAGWGSSCAPEFVRDVYQVLDNCMTFNRAGCTPEGEFCYHAHAVDLLARFDAQVQVEDARAASPKPAKKSRRSPQPARASTSTCKVDTSDERVLYEEALEKLPTDLSAFSSAQESIQSLVQLLNRDEMKLLLHEHGVSYHNRGKANSMKTKLEMANDLLGLLASGSITAPKPTATGGGGARRPHSAVRPSQKARPRSKGKGKPRKQPAAAIAAEPQQQQPVQRPQPQGATQLTQLTNAAAAPFAAGFLPADASGGTEEEDEHWLAVLPEPDASSGFDPVGLEPDASTSDAVDSSFASLFEKDMAPHMGIDWPAAEEEPASDVLADSFFGCDD